MGDGLTHNEENMAKSQGKREPYRVKKWELPYQINGESDFYTCARPGRSAGTGQDVPDGVVDDWVSGLPGPNTAIVSLLGRKRSETGTSEFSHYSFCSEFDSATERKDRPTFQEYLDHNHSHLRITLHEHPTYDRRPVSIRILAAVGDDISSLLSTGRTVVVVDSGGMERTGQVARYLGATEVPSCQ